MPPKRKAVVVVSSSDNEQTSPKRQTRSTNKPKAKPAIVQDSDKEIDSSEVEIIQKKLPIKKAPVKKAAPVKKVVKEVKAKPIKEVKEVKEVKVKEKVVKAKPVVAPIVPVSTSTTPIPDPPIQKKKIIVKPKKPLTWDEKCTEWFEEFAELDDKTKMTGEGIEKLFLELEISMESVLVFILAHVLKAKEFGSFDLKEWIAGFRSYQIADNNALKAHLLAVEASLFAKAQDYDPYGRGESTKVAFKGFYAFLFTFLREEGQKSLAAGSALVVWSLTLAPKFPLAADFVEFATLPESNMKGVSMDVWNQLLDFVQSVDVDLKGYSDEAAWPSILDEFVEWKQEKLKTSA